MKTCCRCNSSVTHDWPRPYCDEHWARWWGGYDREDPYKSGPPSKEMYEDALAVIKKSNEGHK